MLECGVASIVGPFFARQLGLHPSADFRGVLWVPEGALILAQSPTLENQDDAVAVGVGYNAFIGKTCCMHVVVKRPELLNRQMVRAAFSFPFEACGCNAVLALVDSVNEAALDFDKRLGFTQVHRIPHGALEGDQVILQMLRSECRWLRPH